MTVQDLMKLVELRTVRISGFESGYRYLASAFLKNGYEVVYCGKIYHGRMTDEKHSGVVQRLGKSYL